ncbi:MAG: hypothetical protein JXR95_02340 [Deltaproteobacteria bacterium]|nr:hypothetical protein [Deltaproteobacteria bacterium]
MKSSRKLVAGVIIAVFAVTAGCGYFLHPERRNRGVAGGRIDTGALVMDILWLIPGIVPGVIALLVDFTTGAIYGPSSLAKTSKDGNTLYLTAGRTVRFSQKKTDRFNLKLVSGERIIAEGSDLIRIPKEKGKNLQLIATNSIGKTATFSVVIVD